MRPIRELSAATCQALEGVLFDLDDTLLDQGQLTEVAYRALWSLADAGLILVAVTGRPFSWGELIAQQWPIHGAVSENGHLASARVAGRVARFDWTLPPVRAERTERLAQLTGELLARFPELRLASDVHGRVSDTTFDIGEHQRAPASLVTAASEAARASGARTTVSSVHLHVSFDTDDKASGSVAFLRQLFGADSTRALARYAYIGDSENDAPCFAAYRTSIGVANLSGASTLPPRYRTQAPRGAGFAEFTGVVLNARR